MKWYWFPITYLMILMHGIHVFCHVPGEYETVTQLSAKRIRRLGVQLRMVKLMLKDMVKERDMCISELGAVNDQLVKLTEKIGMLTDVEIDLASEPTATASSVVSVKCNGDYKRCMRDFRGSPITKENAKIWCLRNVLWVAPVGADDEDVHILPMQIQQSPARKLLQTRYMVVSNGIIMAPEDMSQPPSGFRTRREYRTLSLEERQRFHDAMNQLYANGVIDIMARIHRRALRNKGAHQGPAFLPWHRAFLAFFEEALREVDNRVTLPYWDSSIDDNMNGGPVMSVMWDDDHLGRGRGRVKSGPFAGWVTADTPLRRRIALNPGNLIRQSRINDVMKFCKRRDIDRRLENAHNSVHSWIGGTMAFALSASDPVFYMLHAFIDYQWEKFRKHQSTSDDCKPKVNPASDYPPTDDVKHQPDTEMIGMEFLVNEDGIADFWTQNWYNYEDTPTCATNCGNNTDMFCDDKKGLCVGEIRDGSNWLRRRPNRRPNRQSNRQKRHVIQKDRRQSPVNITKDMEKVCPNNPYDTLCPKAAPPESDEEYIEDILLGNSGMPEAIEYIEQIMEYEADLEYEDAPDSGIPVFKAAKDEPSDCRSMETSALDLVTALVQGKKISNRGYLAEIYENPYKKDNLTV